MRGSDVESRAAPTSSLVLSLSAPLREQALESSGGETSGGEVCVVPGGVGTGSREARVPKMPSHLKRAMVSVRNTLFSHTMYLAMHV